jgi:hypothetical protein
MLKRLIATLDRLDDKLQASVRDFAENYGRELLAAHGLILPEIDHIRQKMDSDESVKSKERQI